MSNDNVPPEPRDATPAGRKWSRRRVLHWSLGLAPILAGGGVATFKWREQANDDARAAALVERAAPFCFANAPDARKETAEALQASRDYAPALLLLACINLEERNWDAARNVLDVPRLKGTPEARLLLELTERRPQAPDWRHAFFDSWLALGKPDFSKSPLLPEAMGMEYLLGVLEQNWDQASDEQRFALVALDVTLSKRRANILWLVKQIAATTSVPLLMALQAQLSAPETHPDIVALLLDDVEKRLQKVADAAPPTQQLALFSLLKGSTATKPFQRSDLEALERVSAIPAWKQHSNGAFFQEMRSLFDGLILAPGHHAWRLVILAQGISLGLLLHQRADVTKTHLSEDEQRWMGRMLWDIGARLREQRSRLEMSRGMRLQNFSAELTHHVPDMEKAVNRWVELGIWEEAVQKAACYRWPLPSLQDECYAARARDEATWMTAFAGVGELP